MTTDDRVRMFDETDERQRMTDTEIDETPVGVSERVLRDELAAAEDELAELREYRDRTEDRIRDMVFHVETLRQAVGVFDRRAERHREDESDAV